MASLREIRRKIKSVKSTQQITKAMKMVAAARLRRAQARILSARPFAQKMEELMTDLLIKIQGPERHPLFVRREGVRRALLLVTSDKGLCGAFNTNLIRQALHYFREYNADNVELLVVGRKGRDYFRRLGASISKEHTNISNNLSFAHAELITKDLMDAYARGERREAKGDKGPLVAVDMLYNEFKSVVQQKIVVKKLLPLVLQQDSTPLTPRSSPLEIAAYPDFLYEPAKERLLEALIPRFLKAQVFRVLLESAAAELGARMTAMENATDNATELINSLTLRLNRTRQSSITKEILEVVSGAEALK
jgi:F-type H+-transporting ATPase subunit gamma